MKKFTVTKPRSPKLTEIIQKDSDNWFYDVFQRAKKDRKVLHESMITVRDVPMWLSHFKRDGYNIVEEDI